MNRLVYLIIIILFTTADCPGQNSDDGLSLKKAIEISLERNYNVIHAAEKIKAEKGKFWQDISPSMPEFTLDYEFVPAGKGLKRFSERTIGLSQNFEFPTKYLLRGYLRARGEDAALAEAQSVKKAVIAQVKNDYYSVLAKEQFTKIAEENLSVADEFYKKAETRYRVGEGTQLESLTAKVQLAEARNNLEVLRKQVKNAYAALNFTLGFGHEKNQLSYRLTDTMNYVPLNFSVDKSYEKALQSNPLIEIRRREVEIQSLNKKLSVSSLFPDFTVGYFRQSIAQNKGFYGMTFGIQLPLWFMFDQRGRIYEAGANHNIAAADLTSAIQSVNLKINQAFSDFQNAEKQLLLYRHDILPQAEEIYRIAFRSYETGELSYIEYLQSKQTLLNAKNSHIQALLDYHLALISLEQAVGCGDNR